MDRALNTDEVIEAIVSWLPVASLSATIRVNSLWFMASKRFLWEEVYLVNALALLGPVETLNKTPLRSTADIDMLKWERFDLYRIHVCGLRGQHTESTALLHVLKFYSKLVGKSEESAHYKLFPVCRYLAWNGKGTQAEIQIFRALITPTTQFVDLEIGKFQVRRAWFYRFYKTLAAELSCLHTLFLDYVEWEKSKLKRLTPFYTLLKRFESTLAWVLIPGTLFTQTTIERLSGMPNLRGLSIGDTVGHDSHTLFSNYFVDESFHGFSSLHYFIIREPSMSQHSVANLFCRFSFDTLSLIIWEIFDIQTDIELVFLTRIPIVCPNLEVLMIGAHYGSKTYTIQWPLVRSLLVCKTLTSLSLSCMQVQMSIDNLEELLMSRYGSDVYPDWRSLDIFSVEPFDLNETLILFAKYAHNLKDIGVHVHDKGGVRPFSDTPITSLSLDLMENTADIKTYLETHSQMTNNIREDGIFLPRLQSINFGDRPLTPNSVGAVTSLILAISDYPLIIRGHDSGYIKKVDNHRKKYYAEMMEKLGVGPFAREISHFLLDMYEMRKARVFN